MLQCLAAGILGFIVGWAIFYRPRKTCGTFVIDVSDPMKDVCRMEFDDSPLDHVKDSEIVFKIKVITSQKEHNI